MRSVRKHVYKWRQFWCNSDRNGEEVPLSKAFKGQVGCHLLWQVISHLCEQTPDSMCLFTRLTQDWEENRKMIPTAWWCWICFAWLFPEGHPLVPFWMFTGRFTMLFGSNQWWSWWGCLLFSLDFPDSSRSQQACLQSSFPRLLRGDSPLIRSETGNLKELEHLTAWSLNSFAVLATVWVTDKQRECSYCFLAGSEEHPCSRSGRFQPLPASSKIPEITL